MTTSAPIEIARAKRAKPFGNVASQHTCDLAQRRPQVDGWLASADLEADAPKAQAV